MFSHNSKIIIIVLCILLASRGYSQSHFPGQHAGKFALKDSTPGHLSGFDLSEVRLLDSRVKQNMERAEKWILSIDVNRLLHSFRTNSGLFSSREGGYMTMKKLAGWESLDCDIRGHTTGHILSALALFYAATGDVRFKIKADSLVGGLAQVQLALGQGGYLSAFPEELINRNMEGKVVWVPWYTLHKIMAGLLDQYLYADNTQALQMAEAMADWAYKKLHSTPHIDRARMLRNEFGGISECFYNLYAISKNDHYKWLYEFFYHNEALDPLAEGKDRLNTKHANTFIPKLLGITRMNEVEGMHGPDIAGFFWNTVVDHHSFATGSNSHKEHFFPPDSISRFLTGLTGESCNVYNMLKLTRHLYLRDHSSKYTDYYERALFNHILGQQDTVSGMVSYFLPMQAGAHKVYSTPDSSFWCCVGSGFENQARYGEAIYYHDDKDVFVNLYIASELNWEAKQLKLVQQTSFPYYNTARFRIDVVKPQQFALRLRYPQWCSGDAIVMLNGKKLKYKGVKGEYIVIDRTWKSGDSLSVTLPMSLRLVAANDNPKVAAIQYGPIVLAARMGTKNFAGRQPFSDPAKYNDYYSYDYHIPLDISSDLYLGNGGLNSSIELTDPSRLQFRIKNQNIYLQPLFDVHRERYIVYWNIR